MDKVFEVYIRELRRYRMLCESLFSVLEKNVKVVEGNIGGMTLKPTQKTILAEILHLQQDTFPEFRLPLPPGSWIEPSIGEIVCNGEIWRFDFHGMGLSFHQGDTEANYRNISIEFSIKGKIAVTKWTTFIFFKSDCQNLPEYQEILDTNKTLLLQAIEAGYLIPIEPLLSRDDQTYDFGEILY